MKTVVVRQPTASRANAAAAKRPARVNHYTELPFLVQRTWARFLKAYKVVLETVDRETLAGGPMSVAEFELMLYVQIAGGRIRFVHLSRLSLLSEAQISRRVSSLQGKGYLLREATDTDRRATFAVMTEAGTQAFAAAQRPFIDALQRNFVDRIPADKLEVFGSVLAALTNDPDFPEYDEMLMAAVKNGAPGLPPHPKTAPKRRRPIRQEE